MRGRRRRRYPANGAVTEAPDRGEPAAGSRDPGDLRVGPFPIEPVIGLCARPIGKAEPSAQRAASCGYPSRMDSYKAAAVPKDSACL
jgi:hypothetical protein